MLTKKSMDKERLKKDLSRIAGSYRKKDINYWRKDYLGNCITKLNNLIVEGVIDSWQIRLLETTIVFSVHFGREKVENWELLPDKRKLWFRDVVVTSSLHDDIVIS